MTNLVIVVGNVGSKIKTGETDVGPFANFTLWHNPDGQKAVSWKKTVICFGEKVKHVIPTLKKGDLIQVQGKLKGREVAGEKFPVVEIEAHHILRVERFKRPYDGPEGEGTEDAE